MPKNFDLICFDWDGTLSDSIAIIVKSIQDAARELGYTVPDNKKASFVIGMSLGDAIKHIAPEVTKEDYIKMGEKYYANYISRQDEIYLFDGVIEMLEDLKANNHWLAIATGKSRRGLNLALEQKELTKIFDSSRTADETAGKPSPQMLFELMQEFGADNTRTLMIGDTTHDLQMAKNANCPSIAVTFGAHDKSLFKEYNPLFIAENIHQLKDWLKNNA